MAITEVGSGSQRGYNWNTSAAVATAPYAGNVTAGNFCVIGCAVWNAAAIDITSVAISVYSGTATIGTASTIIGATGLSYSGGLLTNFISYFPVTGTGSLEVLITPSATSDNYFSVGYDEFSGVNSTPLDVDGGEATGGIASSVTDTITTTVSNDLIIGLLGLAGSVGAFTVGSGYTKIAEDVTSSIQPFNMMFRIVTSPASYNVDWSWTGSRSWNVINAAFKEVSAVDTPAYPTRSLLRW